MTAYLASRNVMYRRNADWHEKYTLPSLWDFYQPNRANHGSYYFDWTSWDEAAWRSFYRVWMAFLNDYKNMGGRVTVSSDAGYIYNTFGFSTIEEMELLQEAGFHPLEVIRGATMHAAQALFEPKRKPIEFGVVRAGLLADLVIVPENPIANLKVLYGTGAVRLNDKTGKAERVGGIKYTIKDGIVYDARQLLADVARMVEKQKAERGITRLPDVDFPDHAPVSRVPSATRAAGGWPERGRRFSGHRGVVAVDAEPASALANEDARGLAPGGEALSLAHPRVGPVVRDPRDLAPHRHRGLVHVRVHTGGPAQIVAIAANLRLLALRDVGVVLPERGEGRMHVGGVAVDIALLHRVPHGHQGGLDVGDVFRIEGLRGRRDSEHRNQSS